jgi:predicted RNase H-like HicB family nuclease
MVNPAKFSTLTVQIAHGEDGYYVAACKEIPGCASQGATRDEALANVTDAIELCLDVMWEDWQHSVARNASTTFSGEEEVKVSVTLPSVQLQHAS